MSCYVINLHCLYIEDLFRIVKEEHITNIHTFISEKVTPVAGDIGLENFGVTNFELLNEMRSQVDVVVCSGAATKFDERYHLLLKSTCYVSV